MPLSLDNQAPIAVKSATHGGLRPIAGLTGGRRRRTEDAQNCAHFRHGAAGQRTFHNRTYFSGFSKGNVQ